MLAAKASDRLDLVAPVDRPGGVARVAKKNEPRARGERPSPLLDRREVEAVLAARAQRDEAHAGHRREGGVVRVERLDHEGLVALVRARHEGEEDRLAAARRRDDLVGLERDPEPPVVLPQRVEALRRARRGRVGEDARRLRELRAHGGRGLEVGLADVEVVDLHPAALRLVGEGHELADGGGGHLPARSKAGGHVASAFSRPQTAGDPPSRSAVRRREGRGRRERGGRVEAALREGRQDERLEREGFEIGEGNGLGGRRAPLARPQTRSSRAGRGPSAGPAPGARERERRRTPCRRPGGALSPGRGRRTPRARARPRGRWRRRGPRGPTPRAGGGRAAPSTVPVSQAFVRAPASRATCTAW